MQLLNTSVTEDENNSVKRRKIQEDCYAKTVNIGEKAYRPSIGAIPSVFAENQRINSTIFMGRPINQTGPPIDLFHNDFSQFIKDFTNQNLQIQHNVFSIAQKLMATAMKMELASIFEEPLLPMTYRYGSDNNKKSSDGVLVTANGSNLLS
ncbi:8433_t:CDS:2, partial [Funneliformis mosseae]